MSNNPYYNRARGAAQNMMSKMSNLAHQSKNLIPAAPPMYTHPGVYDDTCPQLPHASYYVFMVLLLLILGSSLILTINSIFNVSDINVIYSILSSVLLLFICLVTIYITNK